MSSASSAPARSSAFEATSSTASSARRSSCTLADFRSVHNPGDVAIGANEHRAATVRRQRFEHDLHVARRLRRRELAVRHHPCPTEAELGVEAWRSGNLVADGKRPVQVESRNPGPSVGVVVGGSRQRWSPPGGEVGGERIDQLPGVDREPRDRLDVPAAFAFVVVQGVATAGVATDEARRSATPAPLRRECPNTCPGP